MSRDAIGTTNLLRTKHGGSKELGSMGAMLAALSGELDLHAERVRILGNKVEEQGIPVSRLGEKVAEALNAVERAQARLRQLDHEHSDTAETVDDHGHRIADLEGGAALLGERVFALEQVVTAPVQSELVELDHDPAPWFEQFNMHADAIARLQEELGALRHTMLWGATAPAVATVEHAEPAAEETPTKTLLSAAEMARDCGLPYDWITELFNCGAFPADDCGIVPHGETFRTTYLLDASEYTKHRTGLESIAKLLDWRRERAAKWRAIKQQQQSS